ncbi:MAG: hypothetical protein M3Q23_13985 [Actinomycetota bacterium]|nr:hypothetical protein [Actinomycetota bacterium]
MAAAIMCRGSAGSTAMVGSRVGWAYSSGQSSVTFAAREDEVVHSIVDRVDPGLARPAYPSTPASACPRIHPEDTGILGEAAAPRAPVGSHIANMSMADTAAETTEIFRFIVFSSSDPVIRLLGAR